MKMKNEPNLNGDYKPFITHYSEEWFQQFYEKDFDYLVEQCTWGKNVDKEELRLELAHYYISNFQSIQLSIQDVEIYFKSLKLSVQCIQILKECSNDLINQFFPLFIKERTTIDNRNIDKIFSDVCRGRHSSIKSLFKSQKLRIIEEFLNLVYCSIGYVDQLLINHQIFSICNHMEIFNNFLSWLINNDLKNLKSNQNDHLESFYGFAILEFNKIEDLTLDKKMELLAVFKAKSKGFKEMDETIHTQPAYNESLAKFYTNRYLELKEEVKDPKSVPKLSVHRTLNQNNDNSVNDYSTHNSSTINIESKSNNETIVNNDNRKIIFETTPNQIQKNPNKSTNNNEFYQSLVSKYYGKFQNEIMKESY